MRKRGRITPNGVVLKHHENATAVFLTEQGFDVELIPTSNVEGVHTPDIKMNGLKWEMKAPIGEGRYLMANTIQRAVKQSCNVIVDLRHTKRHQIKCIRELENEFRKSGSLKHLKIITKSGNTLDFEK